MQSLADDKPAFVDLQLRPITSTHLTYAMNVLDWPASDADGQIQHFRDSTFASTTNPEVKDTSDPAAANGDMRLLPMLEIQMDGNSMPLKLTGLTPVTVTVGDSSYSATVHLRQSTTSTIAIDRTYTGAGTPTVHVNTGDCSADGATLYTLNGSSGSFTGSLVNIADGDHSLLLATTATTTTYCTTLPNLLNGPYTQSLIDTSVLDPYGIGVREVSTQSTSLLVYVPLNAVPDDTGGGRVAFQARMLYWPGANSVWQMAQTMRVVWLVQMLSDDCIPPAEEDTDVDAVAWCADVTHRTAETVRVVQVYPESWYVTGLSVREDHGLDAAIIYENAAKPGADLQNQDALWMLSQGLGASFVQGRDCQDAIPSNGDDYVPSLGTCRSDNLTDLSIYITDTAGITVANTTIAGTWGYPLNAQATYTDRLAIPLDELKVQSNRYPHQDWRATIAMTNTPQVLATFPHTSTPTLMFAQTERYRSAGLDALQGAGTFTMTLSASQYKEDTLNTLSWTPYRYRNNKWEVFPATEYWDKLEVDLRARFLQLYPSDGDDAAMGRMAVARSYYVSLMQGVAGMCTEKPCKVMGTSDSPADLINASKLIVGKGIASVTKALIQSFLTASAKTVSVPNTHLLDELFPGPTMDVPEFKTVASKIGGMFKDYASPFSNLFKDSTSVLKFGVATVIAGAVVLGALAAIALTFSFLADPLHGGVHIAARVLLALNVVLQTVCVVVTIAKIATGALKLTVNAITSFAKNLCSGISVAGIVGVLIGIAATWGAFIASAAINGMALGSLAYNNALAGAIGATIGIVFLFVVLTLLGPLGALIGAIIGLIDALVAMLCNAFMTPEEQAESKAAQWLCGGISGLINKLFTWAIHSGTVMVDLAPEDTSPHYPRIELGNFSAGDLVDPDSGIVVGNKVKYFVGVTNTINMVPVPIQPQELIWAFQFNPGALRSSAFDYRWQTGQTGFDDEVSRSSMDSVWDTVADNSDDMNGVWGSPPIRHVWDVRAEDGITLPAPGVNVTSTLYLSEAYAVPAQECWGWMWVAVCYIRTEKATQHYDIGTSVTFDVLPATLDGFYSLAPKGAGYALGWARGGTLSFPTLLDADGDGLTAAADANDSAWDSDNDGLSDSFEVTIGSNPSQSDTDGDGLLDADEIRAGTKPALPDSDGDGLRDGEELAGWNIVVAVRADNSLFLTHIRSNPLAVDGDGDSLTDFQEKLYGFNPLRPNDSEVLTLDSQISEIGAGNVYTPTDNLVKPGASLHYTATVDNKLEQRYAQGLLGVTSSGALQNQPYPQSFVLYPEEQQVMTGTLNVSSAAVSGVYSLTQVAGAQITDWSELSGGASLWLPFDEHATATTWLDHSGNRPVHDAVCTGTGCTTSESGGRYGGALDLSRNAGYARSNIGLDSNHYSVSFWFKSTATQNQATLFSADYYLALDIYLQSGGLALQSSYITDPATGNGTLIEYSVTAPKLQDGNWHHIGYTFDPVHGFELYVDGVHYLLPGYTAGKPPRPTNHVNIGGGENNGRLQFTGLIDDVRVFAQRLSEPQIRALIDQPVFAMNFESTSAWSDTSSFGAPVTCTEPNCPLHGIGAAGNGASFDYSQQLAVGGAISRQLDLSGGRFTMAAWLYPKTGCVYDMKNQLIMGEIYGNAYPSLWRDGGNIGVSFASGTTPHSGWTVTPVLTANTWQHVVATFDTDDRGGAWKLYINGVLTWEDPGNFTGVRPNSGTAFTIGGGLPLISDSKAFCGSIDEVQILNRALSADEVQALNFSYSSVMHMALDEPPGSNIFQATGLSELEATCSGAACPAAGIPSRVGPAAWFRSASQTRLTLPNGLANRIGPRLTVAAWIKPDSVSGTRYIASSARSASNNGWGFGTNGSGLQFSTFGVKDYVLSTAGLQANRWQHVAAVLNDQNAVAFYVNGVLKGTVTGTAKAIVDTDDVFLIGASTAAGSATRSLFFDGMIDDLWIFNQSLDSAAINRITSLAPTMQLKFEEQLGATAFADTAYPDSSATCSGTSCPLIGEGVQGQVGLAAEFDAQNDIVQVPERAGLAPATYSVGAWVKPTDVKNYDQELIARYGGWMVYPQTFTEYVYRLNIEPGSMLVRFTGGCVLPSGVSVVSSSPLVKDSWNHVMGTLDGKTLRLYVNGSLSASTPITPTACRYTWPLQIGSYEGYPSTGFAGRLDEVVLYNHALPEDTIHELWRSEAGIVQDRRSRTLTVDADLPTVSITVPGISSGGNKYIANQPIQLAVTAVDTTTDVSRVQLVIYQPNNMITTSEGVRCQEPDSTVWCHTITPSLNGQYRLQAIACDMVGNMGLSDLPYVYVDGTPPTVTLTVAQNNQVIASKDTTYEDRWLVPLNGAVSDPDDGSGIPADGVRVTMRTPDGEPAGVPGQVATISGNTWSIQYALVDSNPTRAYSVTVEVRDRIGQTPGLSDQQLALA